MPMMASPVLEGSAASGYGVRLSGFHCPITEVPRKASQIVFSEGHPALIAQCESQGYATFLVCEIDAPYVVAGVPKIATYRKEPTQFFLELSLFLKSLKAKSILSMVLSESHGSLGLTLLYVSADQDSGNAGD